MPASYAHLSFGRHVCRLIPDREIAELIRKHSDLFDIGLLGPDILFFYRPLSHDPINRIGHDLHDQRGTSFLDREVCKTANDGKLAYLLGFICHYALDSECHTLVEYYMEKTGKGHSSIETDLERVLMIRDGLDPFRYAAASCIHNTSENAAVIAPFYDISPLALKTALTSMKLIGRLLTPSSTIKHHLLTYAGQRMGERSIVTQLTMDRTPDPIYTESNRAITQRMAEAVPIAIALIENFIAWRRGECALSQRFQSTFSFNAEELTRLKERDARV